MRLGYFYSRYPVISQTFCDMEMLALERRGVSLEVASVYPPLTSLRHEHISRLHALIRYAPPQQILRIWEKKARRNGKWPSVLVDLHDQKYGPRYKSGQRARNALYFADLFTRKRVDHIHVHFANRAAHTALFLKQISGIPFSITAHGQDFMTDLGNDDLLREICAEAEFVAAETDYSRDLLRQRCPDSAAKIHRVYNGIDLEWFPSPLPARQNPVPLILSIGRLVAFKGFEYLIDACAELMRRDLDFTCEIVGDGPLRENLQTRIDTLNLSSRVALLGSLSQNSIFEKLREADIFSLASVIDSQGGSDVFPTVILEAMSAARPVISTQLAGIPESVVHDKTGLLVPPANAPALADALEKLIRDPSLRQRYGQAGRARIEQQFEINKTIVPLLELLQKSPVLGSTSPVRAPGHQIAYLIDRWPDKKNLPFIERELKEMEMRRIPVVPFVCELNSNARFTPMMEQLVEKLNFLPDAMAIEAEWRTNRSLAQKLEEQRSSEADRAPAAIFLREARFALALHKLLQKENISHVHATSSRALVCAIALQRIVDVTVSATIEPKPEITKAWLDAALPRCRGGRLSDRKLIDRLGGSFLFDEITPVSAPAKTLRVLQEKIGMGLTRHGDFWQEWSDLLMRWSQENAEQETTATQ